MQRRRGGPPAAARGPQLFEEFYRRHVDAVTSFVARRVTDPHTVADLTAEIFLAVLDSAHTYRPGRGSETAWLYGFARNVVSSERRRVARETHRDLRISGRRLLETRRPTRSTGTPTAASPSPSGTWTLRMTPSTNSPPDFGPPALRWTSRTTISATSAASPGATS